MPEKINENLQITFSNVLLNVIFYCTELALFPSEKNEIDAEQQQINLLMLSIKF